MSQFNKTLDRAKKKQRITYLVAAAAIVFSVLFLMTVLVISNGTRIIISPQDAKNIARIQSIGSLGFAVGETVYALSNDVNVQVEASGFQSATQKIPLRDIGKTHHIELYELPGRLRVSTSSTYDHTRWVLDGKTLAVSNQLEHELQAGDYNLTIDDPYHALKQLVVSIKRGQQTILQEQLEPISGVMNIVSEPPGAEVYINGDKAGLTPLTVDKSGGQYSVRVSRNNYQDIHEDIEVRRGQERVERHYLMELKKARLMVKAHPGNGDLLLDGTKVDPTSALVIDATTSHQLVYMRPGYFQKKQTISLAPGEEKQLVIQLQAEQGNVELRSSPQAEVWISGRKKGLTPLKLKLPAVPHRVTFRKDGYRSITKTVRPAYDSAQKVSVQLIQEKQARLQEARPEYTHSAGGRMKLFLPADRFTLGAARHEKGQRANEFLRNVSLSKPFYAGLHEVTNAEYSKYDSNKAKGASAEPVTSVSWQDAVLFCNWLSEKEKLTPFYVFSGNRMTGFNKNANGYRLLSEAEWEWLARKAGKSSQTLYVWGDESVIPGSAANIADETAEGHVRFYVPNYTDGFAGVAPVGSFQREKSGLYDMAGNVSEWVHDYYSIVPPDDNAMQKDPLGDQAGDSHVAKGANWRSGTVTELRPAFREGLVNGRDDLGFRIGRYL